MQIDSNFIVFSFTTALILLTPGPTNTLLAAAGLGQGMRGALPLATFELAGYLIGISAWGIFLTSVQQHYPWLGTVVRVASSCYLAYIAVKMWHAAQALSGSEQRPIGPKALFLATLLNPKGLVFASAIFPPHAFDDIQVYLMAMALFASLLLPIGLVWIKFGSALGSGRLMLMNPVKLQRVAALAIAMFSVSIAWTTFH
jgi:threonine/homoserine/homoserine lactone efflux protein